MADDSDLIGQSEIENLLQQAQGAASGEAAATPAPAAPVATAVPSSPGLRDETPAGSSTADDVQVLLEQAEDALASVDDPDPTPEGAAHFEFRDFTSTAANEEKATLDLLRDVELDVKIELGRTDMYLEDVLKLRRGAVVSLDKLAGDPVDVYVNGRIVARGEVLVLNDNFCVRIGELISGEENAA